MCMLVHARGGQVPRVRGHVVRLGLSENGVYLQNDNLHGENDDCTCVYN